MEYRTLYVVRHWMPDDRLARAKIEDDVVTFELRSGHVSPALVAAMSRVSSQVAATGALDLRPGLTGPGIQGRLFRVEDWLTGGEAMAMHGRLHEGVVSFEVLVHEALVDMPLVREFNDEAFPVVCCALIPVTGSTVG